MEYRNMQDRKDSGYIYIATYDGHPDTVKIGLTRSHPSKRIKTMNDSTFTMGTFHLVSFHRTANVFDVERLIHAELSDSKLCKEFFRISASHAEEVVLKHIMVENFAGSDSLVVDCIHIIDYKEKHIDLPESGEIAVVENNNAKFYVLYPIRMIKLLRAEQELNELAKKMRGE